MMMAWQQQEQDSFAASLPHTALDPYQTELLLLMQQGHQQLQRHGDAADWQKAWQQQPQRSTSNIDINTATVSMGEASALNVQQREALQDALQALHPWRKGPFSLFGINIDTEWRSDWKWQRVVPHIEPLAGRTVLDIGCGSGYHLWRMLGAGAKLVLGIDPTMLFAMQFEAFKRYWRKMPVFFLPVGIEAMPQKLHAFDTVFSMGILYHRRSPLDHLIQLRSLLQRNGELVLETLYVKGDAQHCLLPSGRYAKMRNVWFIPSIAMLKIMLQRAGYHDIRVVDAGVTTTDEQRTTDWMRFESLANFLAEGDASHTCEGYPAPHRVVIVAKA